VAEAVGLGFLVALDGSGSSQAEGIARCENWLFEVEQVGEGGQGEGVGEFPISVEYDSAEVLRGCVDAFDGMDVSKIQFRLAVEFERTG
jgi:hypothetical protein